MAPWRLGLLFLAFRGPTPSFDADFDTLAAMVARSFGDRASVVPGPTLADPVDQIGGYTRQKVVSKRQQRKIVLGLTCFVHYQRNGRLPVGNMDA